MEALLLLAGLSGVGVWVWSQARLVIVQKNANRAMENKLPAPPAALPKALENGALVGQLRIPRLNLTAAVREGAGEDTLDVALGHIPGTALPGQAGNVGVAGHRDTLFRGLRKIAKDDVIQFQTAAGSYSYQVESTGIVTPQDVGVLSPSPEPEMTLVTCYPFYYVGPAPKRFIVKARLLAPANLPAQSAAAAPPQTAAPPPAKPAPVTTAAATRRPQAAKATVRRVAFQLSERQTRELVPGVQLTLSWADAARNRANGWIWVSKDRQKIWLRNLKVRQPIMFHRRELMITSVTRNTVRGYLLLFS